MASSFAILELDRDHNIYPGHFAAVLIRMDGAIVQETTEVRGSISRILKSDYTSAVFAPHRVFVRSSGTDEDGIIYTLAPLI